MRFARISEDIIRHYGRSGCPLECFPALVVLIMHQNSPGDTVWPSIARIAEMLGRPARTVRWHLAKLREHGLITAKKTRGPSIYTIRPATSRPSSQEEGQHPATQETRPATSRPSDRQPDVPTPATPCISDRQHPADGIDQGIEKEERSETPASPSPTPSEKESPAPLGKILENTNPGVARRIAAARAAQVKAGRNIK